MLDNKFFVLTILFVLVISLSCFYKEYSDNQSFQKCLIITKDAENCYNILAERPQK